MNIKVTYTGGLDTELDKKIVSFFEYMGFEWSGQGMENLTQLRDINFKGGNATIKARKAG